MTVSGRAIHCGGSLTSVVPHISMLERLGGNEVSLAEHLFGWLPIKSRKCHCEIVGKLVANLPGDLGDLQSSLQQCEGFSHPELQQKICGRCPVQIQHAFPELVLVDASGCGQIVHRDGLSELLDHDLMGTLDTFDL
jgi:hypothetical protein